MLDLNDLYSFSQIVSHGGYSAAARALGQPKSTLSRRIVHLEERLGVRLIDRSARKFCVTGAGRAVLARADALAKLADGIEALARPVDVSAPAQTLRLGCSRWLEPLVSCRVRTLVARAPAVRVEVQVIDGELDDADGLDVLLRIGPPEPRQGWTSRSLSAGPDVLVAAPLLARSLCAEDVKRTARRMAEAERRALDRAFILIDPDAEPGSPPRLQSNDPGLILAAVRDGLGLAVLPEFLCAVPVWEGRLRALDHLRPGREALIELAVARHRLAAPGVQDLADCLRAPFIEGPGAACPPERAVA